MRCAILQLEANLETFPVWFIFGGRLPQPRGVFSTVLLKSVAVCLYASATLLSVRNEEVKKATGIPFSTHNPTIYEDLGFKMHGEGVEIPAEEVSDICSVPEKFSSASEVLKVLARLKNVSVDTPARLQSVATLLDTIVNSTTTTIYALQSRSALNSFDWSRNRRETRI